MDWKSILGAIAPTVATALGGPLAGLAVESIGKAIGMDQPTVKKVQDALTQGQLTGDQIAQIKQAELLLQARMKELEISEEQLYASDRDSARKREEVVQDKTNRNLAYLIVFVWAGLNVLLFLNQVPTGSEQLVARLLGTLDASLMCVLYYYFGSSSGSRSKTDALNSAVTKNTNIQ